MKAIDKRIRGSRTGCARINGEQRFWALLRPSCGLAVEPDRCIQILGEGSFLRAVRFVVLNFMNIPDGLNAKNWTGICGRMVERYAAVIKNMAGRQCS